MQKDITTSLGKVSVHIIGQGQPAILWHCLVADHFAWSRVSDSLAVHRQLIMLDAPGHGTSSTPSRFTLDQCIQITEEILNELSIREPIDWIGNAWGGHVGIAYAAKYPERVRSLITISTLVPAVTGLLRSQMHIMLAIHKLFGMRAIIANAVLDTLLAKQTQRNDKEAYDYIKGNLYKMDAEAFRVTMASIMLDRPDLTNAVAKLCVPTLFITGSEDKLWRPRDIHTLASRYPVISAKVIAKSAHITALEAPQETARTITEFWHQNEFGSPL